MTGFFVKKLSSRVPWDYTRESFGRVLEMRLRHIRITSLKLLIDLTYREELRTADGEHGRWEWVYSREEYLTQEPKEQIAKAGYIRAKGFHDSILWWGVPMYVRMHGTTEFDVTATNRKGEPLYPLDTAITLNDAMMSTATEDFIRGLNKARKPVGMDIQKIVMIAVIGLGVILGLLLLR